MTSKLIVGLDGTGSGERAVAYAKKLANLIINYHLSHKANN